MQFSNKILKQVQDDTLGMQDDISANAGSSRNSPNQLRILGIESSCDDSGVAIVTSNSEILSNIVISQNQDHEKYLGVVPEIAARSHMVNLEKAIHQALNESGLEFKDIDAIAATAGPGLIGGVIVGTMFGKSLASVLKKPFIAVNHLEGHALLCRYTDKVEYPFLLLLASGGHCQFLSVKGLADYKLLGSTLDDAVGEAFDKVGKMLGLEFPGGPKIEKRAKDGDANRFDLPRPLIHRKDCDMSFSGLKTAVRLEIERIGKLSDQDVNDICASFQRVVCEVLIAKTKQAMQQYELDSRQKNFVISGGVAANSMIREKLAGLCQEGGYNFVAPPINLCTDNAAMIAFAGLERLKAGKIDSIDFKPRARWSLEEL